jgi:hypothetical protein
VGRRERYGRKPGGRGGGVGCVCVLFVVRLYGEREIMGSSARCICDCMTDALCCFMLDVVAADRPH